MSNKIPERGDFSIPSEIIDEHEWISDWFIDGDFGSNCKIYYPPTDSECPNCLFDPQTGLSANIYKAGGPISFPNNTTCPWCNGEGRKTERSTDDIRLRVYWGSDGEFTSSKQFNQYIKKSGFDNPEGDVFIIGYMSDIQKFMRSDYIILYNNSSPIEYKCNRISEPKPWGFRRNRYFSAFLKRNG